MCVDHLERGQQALASLGVQLIDAVAQFGDGGDQVGALLRQGFEAPLVFGGLLLGAQIDRAQLVALLLQPGQQRLGAGGVGRGGDGLLLQPLAQVVGRPAGLVEDHGLDFVRALLNRLQPRLRPGAFLARGGGFLLAGAHVDVGVAAGRFGGVQGVARLVQPLFGGGQRIDEAETLRLELMRRGLRGVERGARLFLILLQLGEARGGIAGAARPVVQVAAEIALAAFAGGAVARVLIQRGARRHRRLTMAFGLGARGGHGGLHGGSVERRGPRRLDRAESRFGLGVVGVQPGKRGVEAFDARLVLGLGAQALLGGQRGHARLPLHIGNRAARLPQGVLVPLLRVRRRRLRSQGLGQLRFQAVDLVFQFVEPGALRQPHGGGLGRLGAHDQPVPAPQIAFRRHQPRAERQLRLQALAVRRRDHADGGQPQG